MNTFMQIRDRMLESVISLLPFLSIVVFVSVALWGAHWLLIGRQSDLGNERKFPRQLIMMGLFLVGLLIIVFALPVNEGSRNQVIGLIGILISGILAFSSTTIVSNLMAGVLLRIIKPFRIGDFIRVGDHFGRVSERGLFETEIQNEARELITLPNTYLIGNPVTTIRSSGTIISVSLSLGYDIDHSRVETLLLEAAEKSGLEEPFVHILELGNYAITYRISGILPDSKRLITARSRLHQHVLDILHRQDIEIMSPAYMNQRRIGVDEKAVPTRIQMTSTETPVCAPEDIIFDKAERAELLENKKQKLMIESEQLETTLKEAAGKEEKEPVKKKIERNRRRLKAVEQAAEKLKTEVNPLE